mgnify:CR=1 FL=1
MTGEMSLLLKIIIGAACASMFSLNVKIVWDFLTRDRTPRDCDFSALHNSLENLAEKLTDLSNKLNEISIIVQGNGKPERSIVFRLSKIEDFIKRIKTVKEYRGL